MYPFSKGWNTVAAFGYGMMLTMALIGGVRIVGWFSGFEISPELGGNIFMIGSLLLGPLFVLLYRRSLTEDSTPLTNGNAKA